MHRLRAVVAAIDQPHPMTGWGHRICTACVAALDWADAATVCLRPSPTSLEIFGYSDHWAARLQDIEFTLGHGPGLDAFTTARPVVADATGVPARWPMFSRHATAAGVTGVAVFPLYVGGGAFGSVNLYTRRRQPMPPSDRARAAVLAELTSHAVAAAILHAADGQGVESAVVYRDVDTACGLIAATGHFTLADALALLRAHAFTTGHPLRAVAADVLDRRLTLGAPGTD